MQTGVQKTSCSQKMAMKKIKHFIQGLMSNSNPDNDWCVANAEKLRDADLRSFSIPRLEQRKSLKVGASAKILIESKSKRGPITGERPWVVVTEALGASYKVKIDNDLVVFPALNGREIEGYAEKGPPIAPVMR